MAGLLHKAPIVFAVSLALLFPFAHAQAKHHSRSVKAPAPRPTPTPTPTPELEPGELALAAAGAIVIDEKSGEPLYQKNPDEPFYPASTTKILTALLVIESGNLDQPVVVEPGDTKVEPSSLELKPGEQYSRLQMLYGLMLKSANDVAQALARDNAGSVELFSRKMNQRAKELGAGSSHFENPHGLHNKAHFSTPHDMALIARAAMQQPLFRKIVSTEYYAWTREAAITPLRNHNKLLIQYPGCTGVKTGYTIPAQQVLVSSALRDGRELISVVMHTDHPGIWEDSKTLLTYGFSHLPDTR